MQTLVLKRQVLPEQHLKQRKLKQNLVGHGSKQAINMNMQ